MPGGLPGLKLTLRRSLGVGSAGGGLDGLVGIGIGGGWEGKGSGGGGLLIDGGMEVGGVEGDCAGNGLGGDGMLGLAGLFVGGVGTGAPA